MIKNFTLGSHDDQCTVQFVRYIEGGSGGWTRSPKEGWRSCVIPVKSRRENYTKFENRLECPKFPERKNYRKISKLGSFWNKREPIGKPELKSFNPFVVGSTTARPTTEHKALLLLI